MGNSYFQFEQFIIKQDKCAMKVCTDACIFGAYISQKESGNIEKKIVDIGTGTGLLSLMIAQKVNGNIDAVELDEAAYQQAKENFKNSLWKERLSIYNADINTFHFNKKYDVIVSNPPFFENSLKSDNRLKNFARHTTSLSYAELAKIVSVNLIENGIFYILLPYAAFTSFEEEAKNYKLFLQQQLHIKQTDKHSYFRTIGVFGKKDAQTVETNSLVIKEANEYTEAFTQLLKAYYLYL